VCNGKVLYLKKNSCRVLHTEPKGCIGHKKIAVESGYTSSVEQLISFNELGCMHAIKIDIKQL